MEEDTRNLVDEFKGMTNEQVFDALEKTRNNLEIAIENVEHGIFVKDSKTELQEYLQRSGEVKLEYGIVSENGPDHAKTFTAAVLLDGKEIGRGSGSSKKRAETAAAEAALAALTGAERKKCISNG